MTPPDGVEVTGPAVPGSERILTHDALAFVAELQRRFATLRLDLLKRRQERQERERKALIAYWHPEDEETREAAHDAQYVEKLEARSEPAQSRAARASARASTPRASCARLLQTSLASPAHTR